MKVCILYDPGLRCSHPTSFDGGRNWLTNPREWSISQFSNRRKHGSQPRTHILSASDKKMVWAYIARHAFV